MAMSTDPRVMTTDPMINPKAPNWGVSLLLAVGSQFVLVKNSLREVPPGSKNTRKALDPTKINTPKMTATKKMAHIRKMTRATWSDKRIRCTFCTL